MRKINVIVEKTNTGYCAYSKEILGCVTVGETWREVRKNMYLAIEAHLELWKDDTLEIPECLEADYYLEFELDVQTFFEWNRDVMGQTALAQISGLNKNLISQYANGIKNPSQKQLKRIEIALHDLGKDLLSISLIKSNPYPVEKEQIITEDQDPILYGNPNIMKGLRKIFDK
jgi:predicted RNase H-like HicB family nuclease